MRARVRVRVRVGLIRVTTRVIIRVLTWGLNTYLVLIDYRFVVQARKIVWSW